MKRIEVINNKFTITDTISFVIEYQYDTELTKHLFTSDSVIYYYNSIIDGVVIKQRTRGYALSELITSEGTTFSTYQQFLDWNSPNTDVGYSSSNIVEEFISEIENDLYIYSGYKLNGTPFVKRVKDSVEQFATGVTNLTTDWTNRLTLTYI